MTGISIINGAQTSGSLGSVDITKHDLSKVKVICRIIQSSDSATIRDIVKYNNTQNAIRSWDQYSNDNEQHRIELEFKEFGHGYSRKRGFQENAEQIGIEQVATPLLAFHGKFVEAINGKNRIFESDALYKAAFAQKKARHILLAYTLALAIDQRRIDLKEKSTKRTIIDMEAQQLQLLRHIRFKSFFIAVIAQCLDVVLSQNVDNGNVAFYPEAAKLTHKELAAAWLPVVDALLSLISSEVSPTKLPDLLEEEGVVETMSKKVRAIAYAARAHLPFGEFAKLVSPNG